MKADRPSHLSPEVQLRAVSERTIDKKTPQGRGVGLVGPVEKRLFYTIPDAPTPRSDPGVVVVVMVMLARNFLSIIGRNYTTPFKEGQGGV
jgi:hypothetical protein